MSTTKSKHAFGSEANVDTALAQGLIDAYDILFLAEGKIGWVDKNGQKVILEDKEQVVKVSELPESGDESVVYIYNGKFYMWNGTEFTCPTADGAVDEATVDTKIEEATAAANTYTDEQIAAVCGIIEF